MASTIVGKNGTSQILVEAGLERQNADGTVSRMATFSGLRMKGQIFA